MTVSKPIKRFLFATCLALIATSLSAIPTRETSPSAPAIAGNTITAQTPVPESFGINIHFFDHDAGLDAFASTGAKWVRQDFFWNSVEKEKGRYDFSETDALVNGATKRGLKIFAILCYQSNHYEKQRRIATEAGRQAFVRYAEALVTRYAGKPIVWEIWNEPNNGGFWPGNDPKEYMQLVKAVSPALRKADPNVVILGPSTYRFDLPYIEACLKEGLLDYVDSVSIHPYLRNHPEELVGEMAKLRELLAKYTSTLPPIVCSEWGFSATHHGVEGMAARVARSLFLGTMEKMPIHIYYDLWNDGSNPANSEHRYGLFTSPPWLVPQPSALAFMTASRVMDGHIFTRRIHLDGQPDVFLLEFHKGDTKRYVHWAGTPDDKTAIEWSVPKELGRITRVTQAGQELPGVFRNGDKLRSTFEVEYLLANTDIPATSKSAWQVDAKLLPASKASIDTNVPWSADLVLRGPAQEAAPAPLDSRDYQTGKRDINDGAIDVWVRPDKADFGKSIVVAGDLKKPYITLRIDLDKNGNVSASHYTWEGKDWRTALKTNQPVQAGQWTRITYQWGKAGRRLFVDGLPVASDPGEPRGVPFFFGLRAQALSGQTGLLQLITGHGYEP